jgi:hypothetical protein
MTLAGTLVAVKTQRFVIIPLLLSALYNHWDLADPYAQRYIPGVPETFREVEQQVGQVRHDIAHWLLEEH